eukprot:TRINITY_DN2132_c1_g1_i1.p1 TRINITY_DN2132_c1_g1~~TRINITY_DN2132_c1_g1_i1.p1  ORF type:complete len:126 (+),score=39.26 TRINITY_DN2132_c1_g1_i1:126-503(+)
MTELKRRRVYEETKEMFFAALRMGDLQQMQNYLSKQPALIKQEEALQFAVRNENIEICNFLIEKGFDLNKGISFLNAVEYGNIKIVEFLIDKGANLNCIVKGAVYFYKLQIIISIYLFIYLFKFS